MRAIGFRVEPKMVHYAVIDVDADRKVIVGNGNFHPPPTYAEPESLKWYRTRILQEIEKHKPASAGVPLPEVFRAQGSD